MTRRKKRKSGTIMSEFIARTFPSGTLLVHPKRGLHMIGVAWGRYEFWMMHYGREWTDSVRFTVNAHDVKKNYSLAGFQERPMEEK